MNYYSRLSDPKFPRAKKKRGFWFRVHVRRALETTFCFQNKLLPPHITTRTIQPKSYEAYRFVQLVFKANGYKYESWREKDQFFIKVELTQEAQLKLF